MINDEWNLNFFGAFQIPFESIEMVNIDKWLRRILFKHLDLLPFWNRWIQWMNVFFIIIISGQKTWFIGVS